MTTKQMDCALELSHTLNFSITGMMYGKVHGISSNWRRRRIPMRM